MRAASARMTTGKRRTSLLPSRTSWSLVPSRTLRRRARSGFLLREEEGGGGGSARDGERNARGGEGKGRCD